MSQKSIIITAGGSGKRMNSTVPKQFLPLHNRPVLMHTIDRFYAYDSSIQIILVLPENQVDYWNELCVNHNYKRNLEIVNGGSERFYSVQNGLKLAVGDLIGVHDAVRPLVSISVISNCFDTAEKSFAAVPVIPLTESLREFKNGKSKALNRSDYCLVQTPQCFKRNVLIEAYDCDYMSSFTDDASVVEHKGNKIVHVDGNIENIKITHPIDLKIGELFLENEQSNLL